MKQKSSLQVLTRSCRFTR